VEILLFELDGWVDIFCLLMAMSSFVLFNSSNLGAIVNLLCSLYFGFKFLHIRSGCRQFTVDL
jgi:hypothetical protein